MENYPRNWRAWLPGAMILVLALTACAAGQGQGQAALPTLAGNSSQVTGEVAQPGTGPDPAGVVVVASDRGLVLLDSAIRQITSEIDVGTPIGRVALSPDGHTAWAFSNQPGATDVFTIDLLDPGKRGSVRLNSEPAVAAFSTDGGRAFVVLRSDSAVSFINTRGPNEYGRLALGRQTTGMTIRRRPEDIAFVPGSTDGTLYVAGRGSGVVWAVDAGSGALLAEIETGGGPMALLRETGTNHVYVLVDTINQLVTIDSATNSVASRLDLPGNPAGAAVGPDGIVYVISADSAELWSLDIGSNQLAYTTALGSMRPTGIVLSPDGNFAYVVAGDESSGSVSLVDLAARKVLSTVAAGNGLAALAFAPPARAVATPSGGQEPNAVPAPISAQPQISNLQQDQLPPGTSKDVFVSGAVLPASMAFTPDGRLFYGELRTGNIRLVENGRLLPEPFYSFVVAGEAETGLLGLALDPGFNENHYVYVFYTEAGGPQPHVGSANGPNQVVRLTDVDGKGADLKPIVSNLPSGPFHNAGSLRFGRDGKLYITTGETEHMGLAQDLSSPAGKILRVNPDGSTPDNNPFAGQPGKNPDIWAYGFRNAFDLDFHPVSGVLVAGENGPGDNDELNLVAKGGNYGWPPSGFLNKPGLIDPIAVMNPAIAPSGVSFYTSAQIPEWQNDLFYCNYHRGQLRRVHLAPVSTDRIVFEEVVTSGCTLRALTGPDGALYYSDVNAIYRIRRTDAQALPVVASGEAQPATPTPALPPGTSETDRDVNATLTEWKVALSRNVVPAGKIVFLVENLGATTHALEITGNGIDVSTGEMQPKETRHMEVALSPGTYSVLCPIGNHAEQGMVASLEVRGP